MLLCYLLPSIFDQKTTSYVELLKITKLNVLTATRVTFFWLLLFFLLLFFLSLSTCLSFTWMFCYCALTLYFDATQFKTKLSIFILHELKIDCKCWFNQKSTDNINSAIHLSDQCDFYCIICYKIRVNAIYSWISCVIVSISLLFWLKFFYTMALKCTRRIHSSTDL